MDNWKLGKGMLKDFHFFHHDFDSLSFGKSIRYLRPFMICSIIISSTFGIACEEFPEIDRISNDWKYKYLDLKEIK